MATRTRLGETKQKGEKKAVSPSQKESDTARIVAAIAAID